MASEMKYEIENPEIQAKLRELAQMLGSQMPKGWGFTLLLFEFEPGDSMFYISNAKRNDIMKTMREFIRKFEPN